MHSLFRIQLSLLFFSQFIDALNLPFQINIRSLAVKKRTVPISNTGNAQYVSNITVGDVQLPVLLDTGSSDFWVNFQSGPPPTKDLGKSLTLSYAVGQAHGNVNTAQVKFENYTIEDQAFLLVTDTSTFGSDIHAQGYAGLLGLGPNAGSVIHDKIDTDAADSVLTRIFKQNHHTDNYISFLLDRKSDPTDPFSGQLTISEIVPGFDNITSMPKLDVDEINKLLEEDQHWQALTDADNGIIGPDGESIKVPSLVRQAPKGQFVAVFDSGFTFSQVPREVSDAIYGRVKGAYYDVKNDWWTVPCGQYLNISFNFGGNNYPIHPLDAVDDNFNQFDPNGNKVCIGAFQPITSAFSLFGHFDMIVGMSFLRNTYTLMNFGNWVDGDDSRGNPFIQIASVTNPASARADFIQTRLGGIDTTADAKWQLLPKDQMQHSPVSDAEKKKKYEEAVLSKWPYILTGCLLFVLILVGLTIWRCCCRNRGSKKGTGGSGSGGIGKKGKSKKGGLWSQEPASTAYLPLHEQRGGNGPPHSAGAPTTVSYGGGGPGFNL